jgi:hypothetical protein
LNVDHRASGVLLDTGSTRSSRAILLDEDAHGNGDEESHDSAATTQ